MVVDKGATSNCSPFCPPAAAEVLLVALESASFASLQLTSTDVTFLPSSQWQVQEVSPGWEGLREHAQL